MAVAERILNLQPLADTRPDRVLVYEAQHGQPEAASVLIERYYPRILSFVSHLTYGRGSAEDLTQEVFARALKALGRFNGQYQFEYWLLRIAKNLCIDEARRNLRSPQLLTDPVELPEIKGLEAPDYVWESVSKDLVAAVVHRALAALAPRQRAILVMREMESMSYADIAQVVGTNPRGVEATLRRARIRFKAEITQAESTEASLASCRRVLRLVAENPQAIRSEEAAGHLAGCAGCRRATRMVAATGNPRPSVASSPTSKTAFGLAGPLAGFLHRSWLVRSRGAVHALAATLRRGSGRMRSVAGLAGLGTGAFMAVPMARMAEITTGVVVATVVTLAPAGALMSTAAAPPPVPVVPVVQVNTVPAEQVLFKSAAAAPLTSAPTGGALNPTAAPPAPSVNGASATTPLGSLAPLGLGSGPDLTAAALSSVASVGNILAEQLTQVSNLVNTAVSETGLPTTPLTQVVTGTVNALPAGVRGAVAKAGAGVQQTLSGLQPSASGSSQP